MNLQLQSTPMSYAPIFYDAAANQPASGWDSVQAGFNSQQANFTPVLAAAAETAPQSHHSGHHFLQPGQISQGTLMPGYQESLKARTHGNPRKRKTSLAETTLGSLAHSDSGSASSQSSPNDYALSPTPTTTKPDTKSRPRGHRVLERNRVAATRCRLRKRDEASALASREQEMEDQHRNLASSLDALNSELYFLKTQLLQHTDCGCVLIQRYIAHEAKRSVDNMTSSGTSSASPSVEHGSSGSRSGSASVPPGLYGEQYPQHHHVQYTSSPHDCSTLAAEPLTPDGLKSMGVSNPATFPRQQVPHLPAGMDIPDGLINANMAIAFQQPIIMASSSGMNTPGTQTPGCGAGLFIPPATPENLAAAAAADPDVRWDVGWAYR